MNRGAPPRPLGPLTFVPLPSPRPWGGRRLESLFGRELPDGTDVGESWELADLPGAQTPITAGPHAGQPLSQLLTDRPEALLGRAAASPDGRFPLLVKLLDAHALLSVQVHPDAAAAARLGGGARPKTEAWFVLHADPGATLLLGLRPAVDRAAFERGVAEGTVADLLQPTQARAGDVFLIEAGTVHCLGAGLVLLEVQQPSDTTYRVHDWGRVGPDGRGRELHVAQALEAIRWDLPAPVPARGGRVRCEAFSAEWVRDGGTAAGGRVEPAAEVPRVIVATSAGGLACAGTERALRPGDTVLLPADCPDASIQGADYVRVALPPG